MTLQDYYETPETLLPHSLVDGILQVADAPFVSHQRIVFALARLLHAHVQAEGSGEVLIAPTDVILDFDRPLVLQPDLLFVARARQHIVLDRVHGAPDLVVEVLSPAPRVGELADRVRWFAEYGVREIWLYHQFRRQMEILECLDGRVAARTVFAHQDPIRSGVLPKFSLLLPSALDWGWTG